MRTNYFQYEEKLEPKYKLKYILCTIAYLILIVLVSYINITHSFFDYEMTEIQTLTFSGVISMIQMYLIICMTLYCGVTGYRIAQTLSGIHALILLHGIFALHIMFCIPGIILLLGSITVLSILHKFIKSIKQNERALVTMARTDALTGLPNRLGFNQHVTKLLSEANGKEVKFAVAFLDMDNFKNINDTMGHVCGDAVLCEIAERWKLLLSPGDFLSRQGGDEFALIIQNWSNREELYKQLRRYIDALLDRIECKDVYFYLTASIGVALYPEQSTDCSTLLRYADMSMYYAKREGKNKISFYNRELMMEVEADVVMERAIKDALKNHSYYVAYQPQYDIHTKKLRALECLVRMKTVSGETVSPSRFIPLAEKTTIIIEIEHFVMMTAMRDMKLLLEQDEDFRLAINISVIHLLSEGFIAEFKELLEKTGFPPERLEIEITESVLITSVERAIHVLNELKTMGISIALDDFGTGFASLSYLTKLPIDLLKIDKAFIDPITAGESSRDFVAAIISMGHLLRFDVLSEGVEKEDQLEILNELDCDYVQGYVWGRPMSYDNVCKLLDGTLNK